MKILDPRIVREDFPILHRKINGHKLVYLDNAATSQKPKQVIDSIKYFYENINANPLRSVHTLAEKATEVYMDSRKKIAEFLNAEQDEIVFVRNATEAINLVSFSFPFKPGDRVATSYIEHHSNLLPWLELKAAGIKVDVVGVDGNSELDMAYYSKPRKDLRLVAVSQESNVTGTINNVKEIAKDVHKNGSYILIDAAQSAPHMEIDVKDIDADFLVMSGHKMLAPFGIGVLYIKNSVQPIMKPYLRGGEMIKSVKLDKITYESPPQMFEAGTQNISGAYAYGVAVDYLKRIGMRTIQNYEKGITRYLYNEARKIEGIKIYSGKSRQYGSIFSFNVDGLHSHDVAYFLNKKGIAIRSGFHCAQPFIEDKLHIEGTARASTYFYNTKEEIDIFLSELKSIVRKYGRR
ncbi:cysteine desulfurase [Candidatus Parvarchaeota archaeon]|nr:cysteine desulfurase [Candidatus Parvarchaeota archaeon]